MDKLMELNKKMHENFAKSAAKSIEYFDGDERQSILMQLRGEVEKLCSMEERVKCADVIKEHFTASYEDEETTEDEKLKLLEEYNTKLSEITPNPSTHPDLEEYDRIVSALENDKDGKDGADEEGEDADLQLTCNTVNVIDPVTKQRMTDPVKNDICGHIYDRESVAGLIAMNPKTRCPFPGCKTKDFLRMSNMRSDIVTKTYLLKHPA